MWTNSQSLKNNKNNKIHCWRMVATKHHSQRDDLYIFFNTITK